jgi:hypothetical protein
MRVKLSAIHTKEIRFGQSAPGLGILRRWTEPVTRFNSQLNSACSRPITYLRQMICFSRHHAGEWSSWRATYVRNQILPTKINSRSLTPRSFVLITLICNFTAEIVCTPLREPDRFCTLQRGKGKERKGKVEGICNCNNVSAKIISASSDYRGSRVALKRRDSQHAPPVLAPV